jgi:hypothetical protein
MKIPRLISLALLTLFAGSGCGTLDVSSGGNPDRVLNGTINAGVALPAGAEIVVRLLAPALNAEIVQPTATATDIPVVTRPTPQNVDRVLGEHSQTLTAGTMEPVPFRISYQAEDALLRRGLSLDVRVSVAGRIRFRTINAHVVTLTSAQYKQDVNVQVVGP